MDSRLQSSLIYYSNLAASDAPLAVKVGRPSSVALTEKSIFADIQQKLGVTPGMSVLDIGSGCGVLADLWIKKALAEEFRLCLFDFPKVIDQLKTNIAQVQHGDLPGVSFVSGTFSVESNVELRKSTFDRINMYSVIHYSDNPLQLIDHAVSLLAPGGRLLVGDIPNLDKKGRFLATNRGRRVECAYRGVPLEQVAFYATPHEFVQEAIKSGAAMLRDDFIMDLLKSYRDKGFNAFVVEQPDGLPFSFTREDVIICAPYD